MNGLPKLICLGNEGTTYVVLCHDAAALPSIREALHESSTFSAYLHGVSVQHDGVYGARFAISADSFVIPREREEAPVSNSEEAPVGKTSTQWPEENHQWLVDFIENEPRVVSRGFALVYLSDIDSDKLTWLTCPDPLGEGCKWEGIAGSAYCTGCKRELVRR